MPSSYYTHASGKPANQTRGLASEVRYELDSIAASFALLPSPTALASGSINYALDTGLTNAYVVSVSSAVTAYSDGFSFFFKPLNNNSGASTLNVNTLGLKAIVRPDGTAVQLNDIVANQILKLTYNSSYNGFQLDTDISYANQAAASASAAAASAGSAAASAAATTGAIVAERSAAATLTNKTLAAPVITGGASISGNVSVAGAVTATVNGSDSISSQVYGQNVAGTRAFNWQLTSAGNPALWAYNGSSWAKVFEGSSSGLAVAGTLSASGNVNTGNGAVLRAYRHDGATYAEISHGPGGVGCIYNDVNGDGHVWRNSGSDKMTLDASGNFSLGVTPSAWATNRRALQVGGQAAASLGLASAVCEIAFNNYSGASGYVYATSNPAGEFEFNNSAAGGFAWKLAPAGTAGNAITFTQSMTLDASGNLLPGANGTQAFGSTSLRWSQVWCTAGAFNTSDATLKTPLRTMQALELAAGYQMAQELGTFQWLESVKEKGDKARRHVGLTVQRAAEIMESHGLKPWSYGFMGYDKWDAVTEVVDATEDDEGAYLEEVTRQKTEKQTSQRQAIEIVNGKPILKVETVESDAPVTEQIQVVDADGKPVFIDVPEVPAVLDEEGNEATPAIPAHQAPMLHAIPVMETVTVWKRVEEVRPAGESYAFRSDQLAFFIAAGVAAKVGA